MDGNTIINNERYDIQMIKGDTLSFGLEIEGLDQDLDSACFSCAVSTASEQPLFVKTLGDGIEKVDQTHYRVRVAPADTAELSSMIYRYDFQIGVNGDVFTLIYGNFTVLPEVIN